jgi:hypothetical protein
MGGGTPVATTAATAVGLVLAVAGVAKLRDRRGVEPFLRALGAAPGLRSAGRRVLPGAELAAGGWLLSGVAPLAAAAVAAVLAGGFAGVLLMATLRGVDEPCRCFGVLDRSPSSRVSLARALLVVGGSVTAVAATAAAAGAGGAAAGDLWGARALGGLLALCTVTAFALLSEVAAFRVGVRRMRGSESP